MRMAKSEKIFQKSNKILTIWITFASELPPGEHLNQHCRPPRNKDLKSNEMELTKEKIWHILKDYSMITLGLVFYAIGFCGFILPHKVVIGGFAGIASLVYFTTGLPVAYSVYTLNIVALAFAFKLVGKQFVIKTIFGASFLSLFLFIAQNLFEAHPIFIKDDILLNCIIGAVFCGTGIGFTLTHNGSSGGTDIIATMVSKYRQVSVGRMILYTDMLIISSSYFINHSIDLMVYGFVVLIFLSYMTDLVVNNTKQAVQFSVFSKKWSDIATAVNSEMHRGCTIIDGTGWYTKQEVKMLLIFCRKTEALQVYRIIYSIDPQAFVTQGNVNTIYGEGFDASKIKAKRRLTSGEEKKSAEN